jgi:hypothetical protein
MDTTLRVDSQTRDRLALLAAERGITIRELTSQLAESIPTKAEWEARAQAADEYIRTRLCPDVMDKEWAAAGVAAEQFWQELEAGRVPESLDNPTSPAGEAA